MTPKQAPRPDSGFIRRKFPRLHEGVRNFINHPATDLFIIFLILASILVLLAEEFYPSQRDWLERTNHILTALFALELVLRFIAERRTDLFFRKYFIDIIAVLAPLFRSLRLLRILRLLRVFRVGKLLNRRFTTIQSWLQYSILQNFWIFAVLFTLVIAGGVSFHLIEPHNVKVKTFADALWWSIFTLVGGEPLTGSPAQTIGGRLVSLFVIITGVITLAVLTGIIAAIMINKLKPQMESGDMDLEELEQHIVICGWNRAANLLIEVLQSSEEYEGKEIVLVAEFADDEPETLLDPKRIAPAMLHVVKGDYTRMDILNRAGIPYASEAILLADKCKPRSDQDRDARTILSALLIEKINPDIFTCVELLNRDNAAHLNLVGVEEILVADEYAGNILANAQRTRGIIRMLDELFDPTVGNQFYKLALPQKWVGKKVNEVHHELKNTYDSILISLETKMDSGWEIIVNPSNDLVLQKNDKIVVIARTTQALRRLKC